MWDWAPGKSFYKQGRVLFNCPATVSFKSGANCAEGSGRQTPPSGKPPNIKRMQVNIHVIIEKEKPRKRGFIGKDFPVSSDCAGQFSGWLGTESSKI